MCDWFIISTYLCSLEALIRFCPVSVDQPNNKRTNKRCLTIINADLTYDVEKKNFPLVTTRKSFWRSAIAELIGYIRGYDNAADFRKLGTKTWDANANENTEWLNNPHRKGVDDCGLIYGKLVCG